MNNSFSIYPRNPLLNQVSTTHILQNFYELTMVAEA